MNQKLCPYCLQSSYSTYDNPEWICPYCGKNIGGKDIKNAKHEQSNCITHK